MKTYWLYQAFVTFVVVVLIAVLAVAVWSGIVNESNEIASGVIVDKWMHEGGTRYSSDKNGGQMYSYPPSYQFTIKGEKNGKSVEYSFSVSESDYNAYKIGDEYRR